MERRLVSAVRNNDVDEIQRLMELGTSPDALDASRLPVLVAACEEGFTSVVCTLLRNGSNVNKRARYGDTALMRAADRGDDSITLMLLSANADVNLKNMDGWTALHCASYNNHSKVVSILLENGCNINAEDFRLADGTSDYKNAPRESRRPLPEKIVCSNDLPFKTADHHRGLSHCSCPKKLVATCQEGQLVDA
ncbi:myotrophin-like [Corticium candelabrum]|uniref:myotrophin-like n=1 Tax=Corticium candelabrum TaxID=121492 RepID=UPI002E26D7A6|nr:myotrophin-like [Corticium candelabrum]